jgi:hypothetical protein
MPSGCFDYSLATLIFLRRPRKLMERIREFLKGIQVWIEKFSMINFRIDGG